MKKRIFTVLMAIVLVASLFTFAACSKKGDNTLTVGFDASFPPMGFTDAQGNFIGFDLDLAKVVADKLGLELKLNPIIWESKDMELESGNIDLIWNGFTMNGREDKYTWTQPYMDNAQVLVVKKDAQYASLSDLAGKTLSLQSGSSADKALTESVAFKNSLGEISYAEDNIKALLDLKAGLADAVLMDKIVAEYNIAKQGGEYKILSEVLATEQYGIGFLKGNTELRDKVQTALEELAREGKLAPISQEWFGEDVILIGK